MLVLVPPLPTTLSPSQSPRIDVPTQDYERARIHVVRTLYLNRLYANSIAIYLLKVETIIVYLGGVTLVLLLDSFITSLHKFPQSFDYIIIFKWVGSKLSFYFVSVHKDRTPG